MRHSDTLATGAPGKGKKHVALHGNLTGVTESHSVTLNSVTPVKLPCNATCVSYRKDCRNPPVRPCEALTLAAWAAGATWEFRGLKSSLISLSAVL